MLIVNVPSGIGDIHWVLQKLWPLKFNSPELKIKIKVSPDEPHRSIPFLECIKWIDIAEYGKMKTREILDAKQPDKLSGLVDGEITLQANTHLERGLNLSDWYPEIQASNYSIDIESVKVGKRILIFPASIKTCIAYQRYGGWTIQKWADLIIALKIEFPAYSISLIGADWDKEMMEAIYKLVPVQIISGVPFKQAMEIISGCDYFISFPSGLGILAPMLEVPTTMFMPIHLQKMIGTWGNKEINAGLYDICLFPDSPAAVIDTARKFLN